MLIIIEGIDGSGKTTLCNQLKDSGCEVVRINRNEPNITLETANYYITSDKIYVMDRAILTPWAYRIFDNSRLDEDDFEFLDALKILKYSKVIYCNCKNAYTNSIRRGEDNIKTLNDSNKLRNIYDVIVGTLKLYNLSTVFEYDFETNSVDDVINFIKGGRQNAI